MTSVRPSLARIASACRKSERAYLETPKRGETFISDRTTDAQLILGPDRFFGPNAAFVAFRGSTTRSDWSANSRFWLVPSTLGGGARVHCGFSMQWNSVRERVLDDLEAMQPTCITLSGHSSGAALATIAATDVMARFPSANVDLITFGAPRCGNAEFIDRVSGAVNVYLRVVNSYDIIPSMPLSSMSYAHCSREWLHLQPDGVHEWCESSDGCWSGLRALWQRTFRLNLGVHDHFVETYTAALNSVLTAVTGADITTPLLGHDSDESPTRLSSDSGLLRPPVSLAGISRVGGHEGAEVELDLTRRRSVHSDAVSEDACGLGSDTDCDGHVDQGNHESRPVLVPEAEAQADKRESGID